MDYKTACQFLNTQVTISENQTETFLARLKRGKPPVPGQTTNLLLALKVIFEGVRQATTLERSLVYSLYFLAQSSRQYFEIGRRAGVEWPPLLAEDIQRIDKAVRSIFSGVWYR